MQFRGRIGGFQATPPESWEDDQDDLTRTRQVEQNWAVSDRSAARLVTAMPIILPFIEAEQKPGRTAARRPHPRSAIA
jgi:hypothetical protein